MKKNQKMLIASGIGIAVLSAATLALVLTKPADTVSDTSSSQDTVSVYSYKTDDILSLTIKNEADEFTIDRLGSEKWGTDGIPEEYANLTALGNAMGKAGAIDAKMIGEENAEELAKYGFDNPTATVAMTFKDGKYEPTSCIIGMKNLGENAWYLKTEDSNTVYLVANSNLSFAFTDELDYVNLSTLTPANDATNDIVNRIRVERADFENDLVLNRVQKDDSKEFQAIYANYAMTSHNNAYADDEACIDVVYGLFAISASDAVVLKPTEDDRKQYGLDNPQCVVTMVKNESEVTKLYIGNAAYKVTKDEETGEETKSLIGYYGMLSGNDVIYVFAPSSLPWLTVKAEDLLFRLFMTPYIYYVDSVTVMDENGKDYKFEIIGDADNSSFKYDGKEIDSTKFRTFYQFLLSTYAEEMYIEPLTDENKFMGGFTYDYRDDADGEDTVQFYLSEKDRTCIIVVNGDVRYKVRQMYATRLMENLDALLTGGEIKAEY